MSFSVNDVVKFKLSAEKGSEINKMYRIKSVEVVRLEESDGYSDNFVIDTKKLQLVSPAERYDFFLEKETIIEDTIKSLQEDLSAVRKEKSEKIKFQNNAQHSESKSKIRKKKEPKKKLVNSKVKSCV